MFNHGSSDLKQVEKLFEERNIWLTGGTVNLNRLTSWSINTFRIGILYQRRRNPYLPVRMTSPIYGEPCSTPASGSGSGPGSGSGTSPTDTILLSAMGKVVTYLKALETTKNKDIAVESLNTLILTVTNELSKLK